jgi:sulfite oxidase
MSKKLSSYLFTGAAALGGYYLFKDIYTNYNKNLYSKIDKTPNKDKFSTTSLNKNQEAEKKYITRNEIMDHRTKQDRIWVSYKDGVYDITDFVPVHPGGDEKLILAAGAALEPFWEMYSFHKKKDIENTLDKYRIGDLDPKDIMDPNTLPDFSIIKKDFFNRSPFLFQHLQFPYCAEGPADKLSDNFYTPTEYFFVRNHNKVPDVDLEEYTFTLKDSFSGKEIQFSYDEIKNNYEKKKMETITMCTGNRRSQMDNKPKPVKGLSWKNAAIANGIWEGASLRQLLKQMGYDENNSKGKHLIVKGMDKDFQGMNYDVSIPMESVFDSQNEVLLAYKYNNNDIAFEHGYPLRLIIPGYVGVRNVKWLKSIEISDHESTGPYQKKDYKIVPQNVEWDKVNMDSLKPLMKFDINSAILEPEDGAQLEKSKGVLIKGWAIGTYGSPIRTIEVSFDNGNTWEKVENVKYNENHFKKAFGWTLWQHNIEKEKLNSKDNISISVRSEDRDGNKQPTTSEEIWNIRGLMNNSIHKIKINLI